jgi:alkylation response protein AidB-like acyl-CoA dehydrogenase
MDMELNEAQQQLLNAAKRFFENECPPSLVREMEADDRGFSPGMWRQMADLGWLGLPFPETYGGAAMGCVDLAVLMKQAGRALCPSPYIATVVLAGGAIAAAGSDLQKQGHLPRIAAGDMVVAFAAQESAKYDDPGAIKASAHESNGEYVLNGRKMFVEFAGAADRLLVTAKTASGDVGAYIIDRQAPGVTLTPLSTMARDRQCEVTLESVRVPKSDAINGRDVWPAVDGAIQRGVVALSAYMVGAAERIHEMATDFAKNRVQFGRPIGSFQAIQHYLAQMATEIVGADTMTFYAAWTLDSGLPSREPVALAKILAGDTLKNASSVGSQIHGGIGFNEDVDTTLFLRRGKQLQLSMGPSGYWEDVLAAELLDS